MSLLFRPVRGSFKQAMGEAFEVGSIDDVIRYLSKQMLPADKDNISIKYYGFDERNNWETHLVLLDGEAVGYTSSELRA